ncbi:hypothetical protein ANO11243_056460 [Dothideomycetidae sp. 11243]|nr:hypothetical protein ANO11243_056460 [fungal sp. No.11243]
MGIPTTSNDDIVRLFCNSSVAELRWFIGAASAHFSSRASHHSGSSETQTIGKPNHAYLPAGLTLDLDERVVFFPDSSRQSTFEHDLASFFAGLSGLYLDFGMQNPVPKQCRIRCKNTALHVLDSVWRRVQEVPLSQVRCESISRQYQSIIKSLSPMSLGFASPSQAAVFPSAQMNTEKDALAVPPAEVITRSPIEPENGINTPPNSPGVTLVIPSAGRSSRFPGHKPKWLLTQPNGTLMVVDALSALDMTAVNRVVVGLLREHLDKYCHGMASSVIQAFADGHPRLRAIPLTIVIIEKETIDQVQTIEAILHHAKVSGPIFLKDCDNQFACKVYPTDGVATLKITPDLANLNIPGGKSYARVDPSGRITNIAEKEIISNTFCIGGYSFESADDMLGYVQNARAYQQKTNAFETELAVSDIIWLKILQQCVVGQQSATKSPFVSIPASGYEDWGTIGVFQEYQKTFKTLFVDIDGTLMKNAGQYFGNIWGVQPPLPKNVALLQKLHRTGRVQIILTTSRTEKFKHVTEKQLRAAGVPYDQIIFGMLHAQRIVINDYAKTNPYPSALAINLTRDADDLEAHLT